MVPVVKSILEPISPIVEPVLEPVVTVVEPVIFPVTDGVAPVIDPVVPVVDPVLPPVEPTTEPILPVVDPVLPVVAVPQPDLVAANPVLPAPALAEPAITLAPDAVVEPAVSQSHATSPDVPVRNFVEIQTTPVQTDAAMIAGALEQLRGLDVVPVQAPITAPAAPVDITLPVSGGSGSGFAGSVSPAALLPIVLALAVVVTWRQLADLLVRIPSSLHQTVPVPPG